MPRQASFCPLELSRLLLEGPGTMEYTPSVLGPHPPKWVTSTLAVRADLLRHPIRRMPRGPSRAVLVGSTTPQPIHPRERTPAIRRGGPGSPLSGPGLLGGA